MLASLETALMLRVHHTKKYQFSISGVANYDRDLVVKCKGGALRSEHKYALSMLFCDYETINGCVENNFEQKNTCECSANDT